MVEFTCCHCKNTYETIRDETWDSFKAAKEMLDLMPEAKNDPTGILCDDCNEQFKVWFNQLTDEQKKQMREDYFNGN